MCRASEIELGPNHKVAKKELLRKRLVELSLEIDDFPRLRGGASMESFTAQPTTGKMRIPDKLGVAGSHECPET